MLPPQLAIYLGGPVLLLALLIIWVLPDVGRGPVGLLSKLFFTYLVVLSLWPNYLALQLPGLPWISFRRLVMFPMALVLLICLSVSGAFRSQLADVLRVTKPLFYMILGLTLVQFLTVFVSASPFYSLNVAVNNWFAITGAFFVACWIAADEDKREKFVKVTLFTVLTLCVIGFLENLNKAVLWANHIPSFLAVQDEAVTRMLSGYTRDGRYRVATTFSVSLSMAEYLALIVPFVIHRMMTSTRLERIALWGTFDLILLLTIYSTQSRLGILGWIVAHGFYICVWSIDRWRRLKADIVSPAIALIYPAGFAFFVFGMFFIPAIRNRTIGGGSSSISDQGRQVQFDLLWPKLFNNPFGYGSGRSGEVLGFRQPGGLLTVDSYVITTLLEFGILGFIFYFGSLIYCIVALTQIVLKTQQTSRDLALPLATALLVAIQVKLVLSQPDNHPFIAMLLGVSAAVIWSYKRTLTRDESSL